jgi:GTP 3',8-cyclase
MPINLINIYFNEDNRQYADLLFYDKLGLRAASDFLATPTRYRDKKPVLRDRFNRSITYLRVSVTDRCNFRCVYCMPAEGIIWRPHHEILTFEEIKTFVECAAHLGINKVRITGGEPLVRRDLTKLIGALAIIPGIDEVSLTTNGFLLESMAGKLADAGLKRVNISLDTLSKEKFSKITRSEGYEYVWRGIAAAEAAGLFPIKVNTVAMRGINDDEIIDLARLTIDHDWQMRFIEFMPVANGQDWGKGFPKAEERYLPIKEIYSILSPLNLEEAVSAKDNGPARTFRIPGAKGSLGFISPRGEHFCEMCNRLRLTADGHLRPCLLNPAEVSVIEPIRRGDDLMPYILDAINQKPVGHELNDGKFSSDRKMAQIGG